MFGRKAKVRKAVAKALASITREGDLADHAPLEALPAELKPHAFFTLAHALIDDEQFAAARRAVERALELAPNERELHELAATIARELGDPAAALAAQQRVVAADPDDIPAAIALAEILIGLQRAGEAIPVLRRFSDLEDREVDAKLAEALFGHGEAKAALVIIDRVCAAYEAELREPWASMDRQGAIARTQHARRLRDDIHGEVHGRETVIEAAAAAGRLDATAGVNYRLLGKRLATGAARVAEVLVLQDPDATEARGRALGAQTAAGLALVGSAQLRRGELDDARTSFERASELDGRCFAAFFGMGAVLDHDKHSLHRRAAAMRVPGIAPPAIAMVAPDWPALTEVERNVVWASAEPFAALLPKLAEQGVTIRVLPIDARATDVELFAHDGGGRIVDEHRGRDALGAMTAERGAVTKIEDLLDIVTDHAWIFAYELARLGCLQLDRERGAAFSALYERTRAVGYSNSTHALDSPRSLFASAYIEFLRDRYDLPGTPIVDDEGIQQDLRAYFRALA